MEEKEANYQQIIGQMTYEIDWLKKIWSQIARWAQEKGWSSRITGRSAWPARHICSGVNRTSIYRKPSVSGWTEMDLPDMRLIDEIYTAKPFYGYRLITREMHNRGRSINRKRVRRLMRIMGIKGISPWSNLSKRLHAQYVRPPLSFEGSRN